MAFQGVIKCQSSPLVGFAKFFSALIILKNARMLPTRVVSFPGVGMTCCRCNQTGCCQNGSCVKRGQPCQNYLQQWLGTVLIPFRLLGEQSKGRALQLDDLIDTGNGQMWGTSLMINILLVNVHTLKQSSTMTLTMYILFCLNLWMQPWSDLLH